MQDTQRAQQSETQYEHLLQEPTMIQLADFRCTIKMALIKNSFRIYESFLSFWKNIIFGASTSYLGGELLGLLVYQPMHYDLSSLEVGKFKLHASFSLGLLVSDKNICRALSLSFKYLGAS